MPKPQKQDFSLTLTRVIEPKGGPIFCTIATQSTPPPSERISSRQNSAPATVEPYLNAQAERWVRSAKDECLSKIILFGERSQRRAMKEYVEHYQTERNHQGKGLLFQRVMDARRENPLAVSRAARWTLALLPSKRCVNPSAAWINFGNLAFGPASLDPSPTGWD